MKLFTLILFILADFAFASINVTINWGQESVHKIDTKSISILKLASMIENSGDAIPNFAIVPVSAIRHRNDNAKNIKTMYLCISRSSWGQYEIEKSCKVRFLRSVKKISIPKGESWLFESENDLKSISPHNP